MEATPLRQDKGQPAATRLDLARALIQAKVAVSQSAARLRHPLEPKHPQRLLPKCLAKGEQPRLTSGDCCDWLVYGSASGSFQ